MTNDGDKDYKKEFLHHVKEAGVRNERFLQTFLEGHGESLEHTLREADNRGPADFAEELTFWVHDKAKTDYEIYKSLWQRRVSSGKIESKKRRRTRKTKGISEPGDRQEALARYLEEVASGDEEIVRFRERAMSGRLLSEKEALTFLSSPLLADQPLSELDAKGIGLFEENHLLEEETDTQGPYKRLVIEGRRRWKVRPPAAKGPELVFPGDVVRLQDLLGLRVVRAITFPHPREEGQFVVARQRSVVAELAKLAEQRLEGYPISGEMGVWFILTGEFIPQDPVRMRYVTYRRPEFSRTTLTLEIEGWLPPEEVLEQYRYAQEEILGKTPRSLKGKTLTVFEFVNRNRGKDWSELFEAWNRKHPSWRFRDPRHLNTTYTRALEYIASPNDLP